MTAGDVEAEMSAQAAAPENEEAEADDLASWIVRNPAAVGAAALLLEAEAPMQAETDAARAGEPDFLGMVEEDAEEEALEDPWGQRLASLQPPAMEAIVEDEEAALVALILASVEAQASAAMEEEEGDLDMDFFL